MTPPARRSREGSLADYAHATDPAAVTRPGAQKSLRVHAMEGTRPSHVNASVPTSNERALIGGSGLSRPPARRFRRLPEEGAHVGRVVRSRTSRARLFW